MSRPAILTLTLLSPALAACLGEPSPQPARMECVAAFERAGPMLPPGTRVQLSSINGTLTANDLACKASDGRIQYAVEARMACARTSLDAINDCIRLRRVTSSTGNVYFE